MSQTFRHPEIIETAQREGRVSVGGLARYFGVTHQTIRRDLADLAETGQLERVHGGAVVPSRVSNIAYAERRNLAAKAKAALATACAEFIPDKSAVFLGIGTSTEAVAHALLRHRDLLVVTNNLNVANTMLQNPTCETIIAGGTLRRSDGGLVGPLTMRVIEQFKFDYSVIGCSALDGDGDLLDFDIQEVGVNQTILDRARTTCLVADASKFERTAPVRIASLRSIGHFFTDRTVPSQLEALCGEWHTEIHLTAPPVGSAKTAET